MAFATHFTICQKLIGPWEVFHYKWLIDKKIWWQTFSCTDESFPVRPEMHIRKINQVHFDFMLALRLQIKGLSHQAQIFSTNKTLKWKESIQTYLHQGQNSFDKHWGPWVFFPLCLIKKLKHKKIEASGSCLQMWCGSDSFSHCWPPNTRNIKKWY